MARAAKSGVTLLVGAGIGLGLMYLLDPEIGAERREKLAKGAKSQLGKAQSLASSVAGSGWDRIQDAASHVPGSVSSLGSLVSPLVSPAVSAVKDAYAHLGEQLQGHLNDAHAAAKNTQDEAADSAATAKSNTFSAASTAQDKLLALKEQLLKKLSDKSTNLTEPAKAKYSKMLKDTTLALGRDEDHHYVGQTACALSSLALGAGLVFFFDSDKGHDRRDKLASGLSSSVNEVGQFFRKIGTRLVHRGQDVVDQASDRFGDLTQKAAEIRDNYLSPSEAEQNTPSYNSPSESSAQ